MLVGVVVREVAEALRRAHALFGDGPTAGEGLAGGSGVADAVALTDSARGRASRLSGRLPARLADFTATESTRLDALADAEGHLTTGVREAGDVQRAGHTASGRVADAGDGDTARMSPLTGTPAGRRALLTALRDRVSQQERLVAAYQMRATRMAALMRALSFEGAASPAVAGLRQPLGGGTLGGPASGTVAPHGSPTGTLETAALTPDSGRVPGALTVHSSPGDCATELIDRARRQGYSPAQTVAMLSTMLQESGGHPRAVSPNGLWRGLFQQDASYPGRDDPNEAITGFLARLSARGGPDTADIWKTIFWLQQAPGAPSAEAAYAGGRRAYLQEIRSQAGRALAIYRQATQV